MNSSYDRSKMCKDQSSTLNNDLCDPETGQQYFKPKIGRAPRGRPKPSDTVQTGTQLYKQALKSRERKSSAQRQSSEDAKMAQNMAHSRKLTNNIVERNKEQNFQQIFQALDSDNDGKISAYRIDISTLEPELLQVLSPLFVEMEEMGMSLNLEEFIDAAKRLYKSVSLPEKSVLVKRNRSNSAKKYAEPLSFKPNINHNSRRIVAKNSMRESQTDISQRMHDKHYEYEQRREYKRDLSKDNDLLGCTFQPKLMQSSIGTTDGYNTLSSIGMHDSQDARFRGGNSGMTFNGQNSGQIKDLAQQMVNDLLHGKQNVNDYLAPLQIQQQQQLNQQQHSDQKPPISGTYSGQSSQQVIPTSGLMNIQVQNNPPQNQNVPMQQYSSNQFLSTNPAHNSSQQHKPPQRMMQQTNTSEYSTQQSLDKNCQRPPLNPGSNPYGMQPFKENSQNIR